MKYIVFFFCLSINAAYANPYTAPSKPETSKQINYNTEINDGNLDQFINDNGWVSQLNQIRDSVSHKASELVVNAMGFLGVPYHRGGTNAETGFDCSGFVRAIYERTVGLVLPRRAEDQAQATHTISKEELKPGDLVFFNTMRRAFSHVGIYIGDGKFIHSPRPGKGVNIEDMREAYWSKRFDGARRVENVNPSATALQ